MCKSFGNHNGGHVSPLVTKYSTSRKMGTVMKPHESGPRLHHPTSSAKAPGRKGDTPGDRGDHLMQGHMTRGSGTIMEM